MRAGQAFFFVLATLTMAGGAAAGAYGWGLMAGCLIFAGLMGMVWVVADSLWERRNDEIDSRKDLVRARTAFAISVATTDSETRHFLAREWPELGVEFGDDHITYILQDGVNTQVLLPFLQAFLRDSTEEHFVELRNYNDDKSVQERFQVSRDVVRLQWRKCTELLEHWGYLREGTMAGQSTWKWTTREHYQVMRRRYLNVKAAPSG